MSEEGGGDRDQSGLSLSRNVSDFLFGYNEGTDEQTSCRMSVCLGASFFPLSLGSLYGSSDKGYRAERSDGR